MQYLMDENGLLVINEENINKVLAAKTQELALNQAMTYVERLRLALQENSIEDLNNLLYATTEATNATWGLVYANLALLGLDDDQYQAALHNINAIRSLADSAVSGIGQTAGKTAGELNNMKDGLDDILKYVMDMLKQRINDQIDALEDMKDAYADIISLRKEALEAAKSEADYQDKVAEKVKALAKLQARINALSLDDSRDAQAQKAKLEEEMSQLQKELADTQSDYAVDAQKSALDNMQKAYVNTLKDMVETSYSTSRSFDANKYLYNQAANQAASVSKFMKSSLDAAVNTIIAAKNQSVVINGSGIHVGGDSKYQLRIVDSMIAMTDDNWATAKLAIGLFASDEVGTYFGVNAEVIGGKLIVGNNLVIENETDDGVMQFKVDSSGAWLNNSTFVLQKDNGGKILIDPMYGIAAGTGDLYSVDGTTVYPSFISLGRSRDNILFDDDGMPQNANFYLDIDDGSVYIRGKVSATSGKIGGFTIEDDYLHAGSGSNYIALNGSGTNANSAYAMWAGAAAPASAKFWVKKNGDMYAKSGTFQGVVSGASFKDKSGNSMMNSNYEFTAGYLNLNGLNVGNGNFTVDASGNVSVRGSITMAAGSSINWASVTESNVGNSSSYQRANTAYNLANTANSNAGDAYNLANTALQAAYDNALSDRDIFNMLTNGSTRFGIFSDSTSNRLF